MGSLSIWHWLIVLLIVALVFGTKKLRNIGADLGGAVKGFKEGVKEAETPAGETRSSANCRATAQWMWKRRKRRRVPAITAKPRLTRVTDGHSTSCWTSV